MSLDCIVRPSNLDKETPSPVVFMLHGFGSNKEDLFSFADDLPEEYTIISIDAPFEISYHGRAWYFIDLSNEYNPAYESLGNNTTLRFDHEQAQESIFLIDQFVEEACEHFNLDKERITLLGFSQGAILSQILAMSFPHKYQRVIALSGYLEPSIAPNGFDNMQYQGVKMYISHGINDQVIPFSWAEKGIDTLKNCGIEVTFMEYPTAHGISPQNFYSFKTWLEQNG